MKDGFKVKICGITNVEDAHMAAVCGADYLGVVIDVPYSPRSKTVEQSAEIFASCQTPMVALVFNMEIQRLKFLIKTLNPFAIQFLSPADDTITWCKKHFPQLEIWQSIHVPPKGTNFDIGVINNYLDSLYEKGVNKIIFDTVKIIQGQKRFGGTGATSDWSVMKQLIENCPLPAFLAGGINPSNVKAALEQVRPFGIDLCSGVEREYGQKDAEKIKNLMKTVKEVKSV
jgi:phosphoribosylanthranilate isomerase